MPNDLIALPSESNTHPRLRSLQFAPPTAKNGASTQAFDAADEFLLHEFTRRNPQKGSEVLVVNDRAGALATALASDYHVTSYGDSFLSFEETQRNLSDNSRTARLISSTEPLTSLGQKGFDLVLIRVPKSLSLLEDQLLHVRDQLSNSAVVLCGGMDKHLSHRVNALLDSLIGTAHASLGWRKARLIMATATPGVVDLPTPSPYPTTYTVDEEGTPPLALSNYANVFSRNGLDVGTRTLLPFLAAELGESPDRDRPLRVADLGCGNGVIGIISALSNLDADYSFFDESFMAIQSASENWHRFLGDHPATFVVGSAMADTPPRHFDVILCNPPFHQDHIVGDETAWRMFLSAHRSLAAEGSLLVVGNRHLGYHNKLHRLFGGVDHLGGSAKFVVLHARRN